MSNEAVGSTPSLSNFDPRVIPIQKRVIDEMDLYDYSKGTHEVLLSGSVGSSKTILMAHIVVMHCLENPKARVLLGRRALPDLKATIYNKILEHIEGDLKEGRDFEKNDSTATIFFSNGSQIISRSWADNRFSKVRSLELSGACIEELTETDKDNAYNEIKMRVGRLPHIKKNNFIISATNPDSPSHWVFKYFIDQKNHPTRHVYYSVTTDNPFLPKSYIEQLKNDLDPKLARRMLFGEWIEIADEVIYYAYDTSTQYLRGKVYEIDPRIPVWISWDFNIGQGKPMSLVAGQVDDKGTVHLFKEWVIEGMRTADSLDELEESGVLFKGSKLIVTGDAAGRHSDTRSNRSDYDIIKKSLSNFGPRLNFEIRLPSKNPPIRTRHNLVNAHCKNESGDTRLYLYQGMKVSDEGLRLTAFKKKGALIEDDSKSFQHITTAIGYMINMMKVRPRSSETIIL